MESRWLQALFEHSLDAILLADDDGRYIDANAAACQLLGLSLDELRRRNVWDFTPQKDREQGLQQWRQFIAHGRLEGEYVLQRQDGTRVDVEFRASANILPGLHLSVIRDITARKRAEAALRESETKYRAIFDSMEQGFGIAEIIVDDAGRPVDYRMLELNQQFETLTGQSRAKFLAGRTVREVAPELEEAWFELYGRVGITGEPAHFEQYAEQWGRWFEVSAFRIDEPWKRRIVILFTEVTQRKQVETALRDSEARFRNMADNAPVMIWMTDADGQSTYLSKSWYDFTGQPPDAALGFGWLVAIHPDDRQKSEEIFRAANQQHGPFRIDYRIRRADGEYSWAIDSAQPRFSDSGEFLGYIGSVIDISDRKHMEEVLRESEERLRQMADAMPQIVWITRADGYHEYYNRQWYAYTGLDEEHSVGHKWADPLHPDDRLRSRQLWARALQSGEPYEIEYRFRRHDGQYRWFLGRALPVRDSSGQIDKWFGTCTDIHDRKLQHEELARAKQEAERASAAKSEFLATLSHELRTPLTPVLLAVSLMETHPDLPEALREEVATIRRNVELESRLISDLLDLTRITSGKLHMDMQQVNLHAAVHAAVEICSSDTSAPIEMDLQARRHQVRGDSTRLQQVVWNLVSNAIKFTPEVGRITVRSRDAAEGRVRIEVSDTGRGIEPEVLPRLFTAFEQGDRPGRAGLGLGLAISRTLVEAHGGTITAHSDGPGRGSTFTVELPALSAATSPAPSRPPADAAPQARQPLGILLVEDHEPTLRALAKLLRQMGHRVTPTATVAAAISAARTQAFDVVISDLGLPDASGLDLMRDIRDRYEHRAIALTGYGMDTDIAATEAVGFAEHLTKPVDARALDEAIRRIGSKKV